MSPSRQSRGRRRGRRLGEAVALQGSQGKSLRQLVPKREDLQRRRQRLQCKRGRMYGIFMSKRDVLLCARSHRGHAAATGNMFPLVYLLQTFKPFCFMILSRCLEVLDSRPCFVSVQAIAKSQTRAGASTNKCRTRVRDTEPEAEHGHTALARLAAKKVAAGPNKRHD